MRRKRFALIPHVTPGRAQLMRLTPRLTAFALTCILLVPAPGRGDEIDASMKAGTKLLAEGDRLADEGKPAEAVIRYKSAFEKLLPQLRKIPFKHEVKRDVTKREQLKAMLLKEFEEDQTPEEFHANEMAMKAFGLVPRSLDLKSLLSRCTPKRSPPSTTRRPRPCT